MADLLIEHGLIVTMDENNRVIKDGAVYVRDGRIVDIGDTSYLKSKHRAQEIIDVQGKAVLPGLINAHTHLSERLLPGLADHLTLYPWLKKVVWPAALKMDEEDCYWSALLGCIEMAKSGITCFSDMFVNLNNIKVLDSVARAVHKAGIRGVLSRGIRDDPDANIGEVALEDTIDAIRTWHKREDRIFIRFGPSITFLNSPEMLQKIRLLASQYKVGIHIHMSETYDEVRIMKDRYGKRTVEYLDGLGFLGPDVLAAHCIWLTEDEVRILKIRGVKVVYNPTSNMKLASGVAPLALLLKNGVIVALGSDGSASSDNMDMITIMRVGALLQKVHYLDAALLPAETILSMATINGARALLLEKDIGSIEIGKRADIIVVDLKATNLVPVHDVMRQIIYSGHAGNVYMTIVNGDIIMENGEMKKVNENEVISRCEKIANRIKCEMHI
jgi:5-methylthioadenosine/S-adenosylhomocysteine deaminase